MAGVDQAKRRGIGMFPHIQIIDLPAEGKINAHRDNARQKQSPLHCDFQGSPLKLCVLQMKMFGEFTSGLNLLSSAVMRFRPVEGQTAAGPAYDVLLRPRTLYVMHADLRWQYTHEVLDAAETEKIFAQQLHSGSTVAGGSELDLGGEVTDGTPESSGLGERGRRISIIGRDLGQPGFFGGTYSAYGMVM